MSSGDRPLRLLSLDGGGVRGLSAIYILREIISRVNEERGMDQRLEPWQYFDLIGGTSTGGIIAVMLGRLRMSLDECEAEYLRLGQQIFTPKRAKASPWRAADFVNARGKFDAGTLEDTIKQVVLKRLGSTEAKMVEEISSNSDQQCRVFVCAINNDNTLPVFLRTYRNKRMADLFSKEFKIWEACRATSAATTFFDPLELSRGPISWKFIDGALNYNNPVETVHNEAKEIWGLSRQAVLISIGTGTAPSGSFDGNLATIVQNLKKLATDTDKTANDFHRTHERLSSDGTYFRFNVPGMATIGLEEYKLCSKILSETQGYLQASENSTRLDQCVQRLLSAEGLTARHIKMIDEFRRSLYKCSSNYAIQRHSVPPRVLGTCEWFLEHQIFVRWRDSARAAVLWVSADAGCGKSVLANFPVDELRSRTPRQKVIYFFLQENQHDTNNVLCAVLHQILEHMSSISIGGHITEFLGALLKELDSKGDLFIHEIQTVWGIICQATAGQDPSFPRLSCIVDGLDECPQGSRASFINFLTSAFSSSGLAREGYHPPSFLITSRPYAEIEESFHHLSLIRLRLEDEATSIVRKADRTFLWVKLVFDSLEKSPSTTATTISNILQSNPKELEVLYESALSGSPDEPQARRLLHILIAATRPLKLDELNIAVNMREGIHRLDEIELEPDMESFVKRLCGFFLRIIDSTVYFIHQTARDFLTKSKPGAESQLLNSIWGGSIDIFESYRILGSICLLFLVLKDWDETSVSWHGEDRAGKFRIEFVDTEQLFERMRQREQRSLLAATAGSEDADSILEPQNSATESYWLQIEMDLGRFCHFYEYAARNWASHCESSLKDPRKTSKSSVPVADGETDQEPLTLLSGKGTEELQRCTPSSTTPMIFMFERKLYSLVHWFLDEQRIEHLTPLQINQALSCAVIHGQNPIIRKLVDHANARDIHIPFESLLSTAAAVGTWSTAKMVEDLGDVYSPSFSRIEALITACKNKNLILAGHFLEEGADPNQICAAHDGISAWGWAMEGGPHRKNVEGTRGLSSLLLRYGGNATKHELAELASFATEDTLVEFVKAWKQYSASKTYDWLSKANDWLSYAANIAAQHGRTSPIQFFMKEADVAIDQSSLDKGLLKSLNCSDKSSASAFIELGAKTHSAIPLCRAIESYSADRSIPAILLRAQDYRHMYESLESVYPCLFASYCRSADPHDQDPLELEVFELFLQHFLDIPLQGYMVAILEAIKQRHPCVDYLIQSRVDLIVTPAEICNLSPGNVRSAEPRFALEDIFSAICRFHSPAAFQIMQHDVANVNGRDLQGITPLVAAIFAQNHSLCEHLLLCGADANTYVSYTPPAWFQRVHEALHYGNEGFIVCPLVAALLVEDFGIFKLLLEHGADPWHDYQGYPVDWSAQNTQPRMSAFFWQTRGGVSARGRMSPGIPRGVAI